HRRFERRYRLLAPDEQRDDAVGEYDDVAKRQNGEKASHGRYMGAHLLPRNKRGLVGDSESILPTSAPTSSRECENECTHQKGEALPFASLLMHNSRAGSQILREPAWPVSPTSSFSGDA